jgi:(R,R)-butanediol dehydrogenase/meso-butanediol dehydrogenase/diacetyl reductase
MGAKTMRAAVYHGAGDIRITEVPVPTPEHGDLLLEIHAVGICGTDAQEYTSGPHLHPFEEPHPVTGHTGPIIPGHEFTGRVVDIASGVDGFLVGEVVASGAGLSCGMCWQCRRGRTNTCERYATVGFQRHGALAQYCTVPASICMPVEPYGLTEDTAALAQPMAIAVHSMRRGRLMKGETVVIIGVGGIGGFLTSACVQYGAEVIVADLTAERLAIAHSLGAKETIRVDQVGPDLATLATEAGVAPAVVYEVSGTASGFTAAMKMLPSGGRLVAVGLQHAAREIDLRTLTLAEREIIGTNALIFRDDLPEALRLLAARDDSWRDIAPIALPLDELVSEGLLPLAEGRSRRIKTLVDPWIEERRDTVMSRSAPVG